MELKQLLKLRVRVIDMQQNSPEWFELRRTKKTASETPIIMGLSPWSSPSQLAIEKFSSTPPAPLDNAAVRHGHLHEPVARSIFERQYELHMPPTVMVRGDFMASLDGWNKRENKILEIKCPFGLNQSDTWIKACDDEIADHYYAQIQHQLMVSGASRCNFWVFDTQRRKGIRVVVEPDERYYLRILFAWEEFMRKYA